MKRILVPTDFSPTSERAFRYAFDLAQKTNGTIILYHSYTPMENAFIETGESKEELNQQTEEEIMKRLDRLKNKVIGGSSLSVTTILGRSPIIDNILSFAGDNSIELIIMGTQGATGLRKILIGTVAGRIIERTVLPVILIPEQYELSETTSIVFTTSDLNMDSKYLNSAIDFARVFQADLQVVHLHTAMYDADESAKKEKEFADFKASVLNNMPDKNLNFKMINIPSAAKGMEDLHKRIPYDLLIMVRRKRTFLEKFFLESFTRNMAYITTKPLLIIPE